MKTLLYRLFVLVVLLTPVYTPDYSAMRMQAATPQTAAQKQKAAAQVKKKKEADKKKAQKQKEQAKKQKAQQKAAAAKQEARAKQQEQTAKAQAQRQAQKQADEEAQKQAWLRQQEALNDPTPRKEVVSLINIGAKAGYAGIMDRMANNYANISSPNELGNDYVYHSLKGGPGAGLSLTYELEYGAFRFATGLDFTYLNSTSAYEFSLMRRLEQPYGGNYFYITDDLHETRNAGYVGLPILFGAQFSRYYFMAGAKVGYGLFGNYSQRGQYDIVVKDDALRDPYGLGIYDVPTLAKDQHKLLLQQPSVSLCAEVGIDLDEWLQAQPDKKNKKRTKPGERLPFGREHLHYKLGIFAEYGILNTNKANGTYPLSFETTSPYPQQTNSMLSVAGTRVNNLFVGLKFTIQFEIPGKVARPIPAPASAAEISVYDKENMTSLTTAIVKVDNTANNRTVMKPKTLTKGFVKQRTAVGEYVATAKAENYYPESVSFTVDSPGIVVPVKIYMQRRPVFRVNVTDKETGAAIATQVQITRKGHEDIAYSLTTDSVNGSSEVMLRDSIQYALHIEQIGYESVDTLIRDISDKMDIALIPIKKGEIFVMKNLFFATNKTRILSSSEDAMNALFSYLERNKDIRIRIIGHTDNVGKDEANQRLSEGRANAVRQDLIEKGIDADRIEAEGRGESEPIDTNDTEEGRQNNRRVEIEIL